MLHSQDLDLPSLAITEPVTEPITDEPEPPNDTNNHEQAENLSISLGRIKISDDPRSKLRSWLGKILKVIITDERVIVGCFACTDREGNTILENAWEYYTQSINGEFNDIYLMSYINETLILFRFDT